MRGSIFFDDVLISEVGLEGGYPFQDRLEIAGGCGGRWRDGLKGVLGCTSGISSRGRPGVAGGGVGQLPELQP